jgi:hypothetical protein
MSKKKYSNSNIEDLLTPNKTMKEETKEWLKNKRRDLKAKNTKILLRTTSGSLLNTSQHI